MMMLMMVGSRRSRCVVGNELWLLVGRYNVGWMSHIIMHAHAGVNLIGDMGFIRRRSGAGGGTLSHLAVVCRRWHDKPALDPCLQLDGGTFAIPLLDLREGIIKLGFPQRHLRFEDKDGIPLTLATCRGRFAIAPTTLIATPCSSLFFRHGNVGIVLQLRTLGPLGL